MGGVHRVEKLTGVARAIMAQPKYKWVALVDAWPESEREPIRERIRLIHRGEWVEPVEPPDELHRTPSFVVKLSHGKTIPMIIPEGATQAEADQAAQDRFFNYEIAEVLRV